MTQFWHGGDIASYIVGVGAGNAAIFQPGAAVKIWNARTGGAQITELLDAAGNPITQLAAGSGSGGDGWPVGGLPRYKAPTKAVWVGADGQPRVLSITTDIPDLLDALVLQMQGAVSAANAAAAAATELAGSSSVTGHEAALDPHPAYVNNTRGDARYVRANLGTIAPLQAPVEVATFASTPPQNAANWMELWVIEGGTPRLVSWENERRYPRHEQVPGSLWDKLYEAVVAYNGTGRAYSVQIRGADNIRRDAGGIDAKARLVTSEQPWTQVVAVDPDATGKYSASPTVGPSPLGVRWEADDVVRLQGRIRATGVTAGDSLASLPAGFPPLSARLHAVPTSTGALVVCELLPTGRVVARTTVAGPLDVSLDDVTYVRVVAPQPTGDFTIASAGTATPGTVSPLTVAHAGATGRLYLLVLSRSSATDAYTTVTDNAGNTWTRRTFAPASGSVGRRIELWTCQPGATFATVSAAFSGTGTAYASLYYVTGHNVANPIDQIASNFRAAATAPAAVEVTPSVPATLAVAAIAASPNTLAQTTPSGGWTVLPSSTGGPAVVYQTNPANGVALGVSWTLATASGSGHAIATIRPE
ncbi:hypothetical protein AB0A95_30690 [Micromonospora sp. NPDC049230]|uniref:hypothetical protein n=1 Tax=Micromonospora sp. NPDC049230 TaxID=3155502 RepID=UPI00340B1746